MTTPEIATPPQQFAAYNTATGDVVEIGHIPPDFDLPVPPDGFTLYVGAATFDDYFVQGEKYTYTPEQLAARAAQPAYKTHWDNATMAWVDDRDLAQLRIDKWEEIKKARDAAEFGGFVWDSSSFDSDAMSQSRIQGAAQLASLALSNAQPFSIDWTLADNNVRTLDANSMLQVGTALGTHITTQHAKGRALRVQIEDPTATYPQVLAVAW